MAYPFGYQPYGSGSSSWTSRLPRYGYGVNEQLSSPSATLPYFPISGSLYEDKTAKQPGIADYLAQVPGMAAYGLGTVLDWTVGLPKKGLDYLAREVARSQGLTVPDDWTMGKMLRSAAITDEDFASSPRVRAAIGKTLELATDFGTDPVNVFGIGAASKVMRGAAGVPGVASILSGTATQTARGRQMAAKILKEQPGIAVYAAEATKPGGMALKEALESAVRQPGANQAIKTWASRLGMEPEVLVKRVLQGEDLVSKGFIANMGLGGLMSGIEAGKELAANGLTPDAVERGIEATFMGTMAGLAGAGRAGATRERAAALAQTGKLKRTTLMPIDRVPDPLQEDAEWWARDLAQSMLQGEQQKTLEQLPEYLRPYAKDIWAQAREEAPAMQEGRAQIEKYRKEHGQGAEGITREPIPGIDDPNSFRLIQRNKQGDVIGGAQVDSGGLTHITGGRAMGANESVRPLYQELEKLGVERPDAAPLTAMGAMARRRAAERQLRLPRQVLTGEMTPREVQEAVNKARLEMEEEGLGDLVLGPMYAVDKADRAKPYFSQLRRVVDDPKTQAAQRGGDWLKFLSDPKRAVKAAELEWTGLGDYLKSRSGERVTKQEVQEYLNNNAFEVEEVVRGDQPALQGWRVVPSENVPGEWDVLDDTRSAVFPEGRVRFTGTSEAEATAYIRERAAKIGSRSNVMFGSEELSLPGGKDYREVVITRKRRPVYEYENIDPDAESMAPFSDRLSELQRQLEVEMQGSLDAQAERDAGLEARFAALGLAREAGDIHRLRAGDPQFAPYREADARAQQHDMRANAIGREMASLREQARRATVDRMRARGETVIDEQLNFNDWLARSGELERRGIERGPDAEAFVNQEWTRGKEFADGTDTIGSDLYDAWRADQDRIVQQRDALRKDTYTGGHFPDKDVLAHFRFKEDQGPNGERVLRVEEIQSDWAEQGRDLGFKKGSAAIEAERKALEAERMALIAKAADPAQVTPEAGNRFAAILRRLKEIEYDQGGALPDAPFVKKTDEWVGLAAKRILKYAVDNGFDKVAWTTGEHQNARYDLSKRVKSVEYSEPTQTLRVYGPDDSLILIEDRVTPGRIATLIGKEAAEKLLRAEAQNPIVETVLHTFATQSDAIRAKSALRQVERQPDVTYVARPSISVPGEFDVVKITGTNEPTRSLEGIDLKVGGEGMRAFYDEIVPQAFARLVKKFGGKVGQTEIDLSGMSFDALTAGTARMKQDPSLTRSGRWSAWGPDEVPRDFATEAEARRFAEQTGGDYAPQLKTMLHSVDITPEMRESVRAEGFPLFAVAKKGEKAAATPAMQELLLKLYPQNSKIKVTEDGRYVITLPNKRTVTWKPNVDYVEIDLGAYEKGYQKKATGKERAVGVTYRLPGSAVVEIVNGANMRVPLHEHWHVIKHLGTLTDKQLAQLAKKFKNEEAEADAFADWFEKGMKEPNTIWQRVYRGVKNVYDALIGAPEAVFKQAVEGAFKPEKTGPPSMDPAMLPTAGGWKALWGEGGPVGKLIKNANSEEKRAAGAPPGITTMADFEGLRRRVKEMAWRGQVARQWYTKSSQEILDAVSGDRVAAEKIAQLIAIYSPNTDVDMNLDAALRAWNQYKAGAKEIHSGRYSAMDERANQLLFGGKDWEGRKTNNFYRNLMLRIDPTNPALKDLVTVDVHIMRAMGYPDPKKGGAAPGDAQYSWVEKVFKDIAHDIGWDPHEVQAAVWTTQRHKTDVLDKLKPGEKAPPITSYDFADAARDMVGHLNLETVPHGSTGVLPELGSADYATRRAYTEEVIKRVLLDADGRDRIAAMLGIPMHGGFFAPGYYKGRGEPGYRGETVMSLEAGGNAALLRHLGFGEWTITKDKPEPGSTASRYLGAPLQISRGQAPRSFFLDQKTKTIYIDGLLPDSQYQSTVTAAIKKLSGKPAEVDTYQRSSREMDPYVERQMRRYAAAVGYVFRQEGVGFGRSFPAKKLGEANGYFVDMGRQLTAAETETLMLQLAEELGTTVTDATMADIFPKTIRDGVTVINFSGLDNPTVLGAVQRAARKAFPDVDFGVNTGYAREVGGLVSNDWVGRPKGESYVEALAADEAGAGGSSDVLAGVQRLRAEADAFNAEFAASRGWRGGGTAFAVEGRGPEPRPGVGRPVEARGPPADAVLPDAARPRLYVADLEGMLSPGAKQIRRFGDVILYEDGNSIIATVGGKEVGFAALMHDGTDLAVAIEFQNRGIGTELLREFKKKFPDQPTGGLTEAGRRTLARIALEPKYAVAHPAAAGAEPPPMGRPMVPGESPRVERRVESLERAIDEQRALGIPAENLVLARGTRRTWKSLDPEVREKLKAWDDKAILDKIARKEHLDDVEVQALDAAVRGRREAKELARLEYQEAAGTSREAEARRKYAESVANFLTLERANVNDGTGTARALAARARIMEAGATADRQFMRQVFRELPGIDDASAAELQQMFETGDPRLSDALRAAMAGRWKQWQTLLRAFLITPSSEIANTLGNSIVQGIELADTGAAAGVDWLVSRLRGTGRERYLGEVGAELGGMVHAVPEAINSFLKERFWDIYKRAWTGESKKIQLGRRLEHQVSPFKSKLGRLAATSLDALQAGDELFQAPIAQGELTKRAYRQARRELGQQADIVDVQRRTLEIAQDVVEHPERNAAMLSEIKGSVDRRLFRNKPWKPVEIVRQMTDRYPWLTAVVPFVKTPANIARYAIHHSPLGMVTPDFVKAIEKLAGNKGEMTQGQASDIVAQRLVGTVIFGAAVVAAKTGKTTGSGPADLDERKALMETGWRPYSFRIQVPGGQTVYVPFSRFDPVAQMFGVAADVVELKDTRDANDVASKAIGSIAENFTNRTYLKGLIDFTEAVNDPMRFAGQYASNIASMHIPRQVARIAQAIDPVMRDVRPAGKGVGSFAERVLNTAQSNVPWLSEQLPARYGPTGEVITRPGEGIPGALMRAFSPIQISQAKPGKNLEGLMAEIGYVPSPPRNVMTIRGVQIPISPQQLEVVHQADRAAAYELRMLITNPLFGRLPKTIEEGGSNSQEGVIRKLYDKHRDMARRRILQSWEFQRTAQEELAKAARAGGGAR